MIRQGPHQGAQKSTSTGLSASSTSAWKLLSVTSSRLPATFAPFADRVASENIASTPESQGGHLPDRLKRDSRRHLRLPLAALPKQDRYLRDREAGLDGLVGELDLEAVAVRVHGAQVDRLEHAPVEALEAAGQVTHGHAE